MDEPTSYDPLTFVPIPPSRSITNSVFLDENCASRITSVFPNTKVLPLSNALPVVIFQPTNVFSSFVGVPSVKLVPSKYLSSNV